MSKAPSPNKIRFGGKIVKADLSSDAKLPSQKALNFLTQGPPSRQRILQFGRLTPIGSGSPTFGALPPSKSRSKKGGF